MAATAQQAMPTASGKPVLVRAATQPVAVTGVQSPSGVRYVTASQRNAVIPTPGPTVVRTVPRAGGAGGPQAVAKTSAVSVKKAAQPSQPQSRTVKLPPAAVLKAQVPSTPVAPRGIVSPTSTPKIRTMTGSPIGAKLAAGRSQLQQQHQQQQQSPQAKFPATQPGQTLPKQLPADAQAAQAEKAGVQMTQAEAMPFKMRPSVATWILPVPHLEAPSSEQMDKQVASGSAVVQCAAAEEASPFSARPSVATWLLPLPQVEASSSQQVVSGPAVVSRNVASEGAPFNMKPSVGTWVLPLPHMEARSSQQHIKEVAVSRAAAAEAPAGCFACISMLFKKGKA